MSNDRESEYASTSIDEDSNLNDSNTAIDDDLAAAMAASLKEY